MRKLNSVIFLFILATAVLLYKNMNLYFNVRIMPAKLNKSPIEGKWNVERYVKLGDSDLSDEEIKNLIGSKAVFTKTNVSFNKENCKRPNFKIKVVEAQEYFMNDLKIKPSELGISEDNVKVITISSNNTFFDEYIQINDTSILKIYDGVALFFKKEGKATNTTVNKDVPQKNEGFLKKVAMDKNGLLLGLRYKSGSGYKYRTMWISGNADGEFSVKEMDNLLVPRKSGFFMIQTNQINSNGINRDVIYAGPYNKDIKDMIKFSQRPSTSNISYKINFVGNEYMSLEKEELSSNNGEQHSLGTYLSVVPLDNIYGNSIVFSKIVRDTSNDVLQEYAEKFLTRRGKSNFNLDRNALETSWGVVRQNGKWILRGQVSNGYYTIGINAPKELTSYDQLSIPFNKIKEKFPNAIDAYTSINRKFMVVLTKSNLMVMNIDNNTIGKVKANISLNDSEVPVMSQWSTGNYVDEWAKMFKNK